MQKWTVKPHKVNFDLYYISGFEKYTVEIMKLDLTNFFLRQADIQFTSLFSKYTVKFEK